MDPLTLTNKVEGGTHSVLKRITTQFSYWSSIGKNSSFSVSGFGELLCIGCAACDTRLIETVLTQRAVGWFEQLAPAILAHHNPIIWPISG